MIKAAMADSVLSFRYTEIQDVYSTTLAAHSILRISPDLSEMTTAI